MNMFNATKETEVYLITVSSRIFQAIRLSMKINVVRKDTKISLLDKTLITFSLSEWEPTLFILVILHIESHVFVERLWDVIYIKDIHGPCAAS